MCCRENGLRLIKHKNKSNLEYFRVPIINCIQFMFVLLL